MEIYRSETGIRVTERKEYTGQKQESAILLKRKKIYRSETGVRATERKV
jgi:hypothetical protein